MMLVNIDEEGKCLVAMRHPTTIIILLKVCSNSPLLNHIAKSTHSTNSLKLCRYKKPSQGNQYVLVFQDFLTKWPLVYAMPDQRTDRIVKILVEEIVPNFGVPESLLSDRGTNLLSHLMLDV